MKRNDYSFPYSLEGKKKSEKATQSKGRKKKVTTTTTTTTSEEVKESNLGSFYHSIIKNRK